MITWQVESFRLATIFEIVCYLLIVMQTLGDHIILN